MSMNMSTHLNSTSNGLNNTLVTLFVTEGESLVIKILII